MWLRLSGLGGDAYSGYVSVASIAGPPSIGWPNPSSTRPSKLGPTAKPRVLHPRDHLRAELQAVRLVERHRQHSPITKSDHLGPNPAAFAPFDFAKNLRSPQPDRWTQSTAHRGCNFAAPRQKFHLFQVAEIAIERKCVRFPFLFSKTIREPPLNLA